MSNKSKRRGPTPILPSEGSREALREKLPHFQPHDISALIKEAKSTTKTDIDRALVAASRRRTDEQLLELLHCLGIEPSDQRAWEKGFYLLAFCHHDAGPISVYQSRTNRNAAKWTTSHDCLLLKEVMILKRNGLSERAAVKRLAADKTKVSQFPYRSWRHSSVRDELKNREDALWARLQKLKSKGRDQSHLAQILGADDGGLSSIEALLLASTFSRLQQGEQKNST